RGGRVVLRQALRPADDELAADAAGPERPEILPAFGGREVDRGLGAGRAIDPEGARGGGGRAAALVGVVARRDDDRGAGVGVDGDDVVIVGNLRRELAPRAEGRPLELADRDRPAVADPHDPEVVGGGVLVVVALFVPADIPLPAYR